MSEGLKCYTDSLRYSNTLKYLKNVTKGICSVIPIGTSGSIGVYW